MKRTFLVCLLALTVASTLLHWSLPEQQSAAPVLYWVTQNDPVKRETTALFRDWLVAQGLPPVEVRIDNASQQRTGTTGEPKELIQGVSGMGGDLIDIYLYQMELFQATGMLMDVTEIARRESFDPSVTYQAINTDIVLDGRQYGFPRNADVVMCWVNRDTFARYGQPEPPARWTMDEFEERGRRFVAAANPPGSRKRIFFLNRVWPSTLRRGLGLSTYNETATRCTLDDPRNVEVMKRIYRWTVEEKLIPTIQEQEALAADASGWDSSFSLFATGRFAMLYEGLWAIIRLRPKGDFRLSAVEPFNGGFPNAEIGCGVVSVYAGSKHPELALQFLRFLASKPFNRLVARSGDSLPVLPSAAKSDDFHPRDHPGEWAAKDVFAKAGREIGIAASKSAFVLPSIVFRADTEAIESMLAGRMTPEEAARTTANRVNSEIALRVRQDPTLRRSYEERVKIQQQIEARRAARLPVPASWISDPFHLTYYRAHGWLEKEAAP